MKRTIHHAISLLGLLLAMFPAVAQIQLPPDDAYVTVKDGHLNAGGQRVRLWCAIGGYPNPSGIEPNDDAATRTKKRDRAYRDAEAILSRFESLGFNGLRMWQRAPGNYVKGDGSPSDVTDYFVSLAKARGFRIWLPSVSVAPSAAADVELVDDSATREAWQAAMLEKDRDAALARVWDPRLETAMVSHMKKLTNHVNLHTGLRWGDDPVFAIWELTNEEWWMMKMVGGQWMNLPQFFRETLAKRWHAFLGEKYRNEDALVSAWGFLLPGEKLDKGTVQIAPLASGVEADTSGMDAQARAQVEAARAQGKQKWTRDDFTRARGADVLEFFLKIQLAHKERLKIALKAMGKSCRLGPVVYDTGIGYEAQSQYLHQNAEAVAHDAYINGFTDNKLNQRYPWYSGLEEWPKISQDLPWLEHNKVEGKPYLCYETQIMQPAKYRTEYPLRLLALAAIQDWDAICWHYWGNVPDITTNPKPFEKSMDNTTGWHPQGYHYTYDAVQNAVMRAAAHAFRGGLLRPAPKPTTFIWGRKTLYDPASMNYGGSYGREGLRMMPTTYTNGVRILIDPSRENDAIEGPSLDPISHTLPNLIRSTDQITWDVARAGLKLDAPAAIGFTGFFTNFGQSMSFGNGVTLEQVQIAVPKTMPYPEGIAEERYIGFALVSEDGRPLSTTTKATLALQSTSFNTGFKMLFKEGALSEGGGLPVLTAQVSAIVRGKAIAGMNFRFIDWNFGVIGKGKIGGDGALKIPSNVPIWIIELTR